MSPSITKAEQAMLGRRALQPVKAEGELLAVFVSGVLSNPLNGTPWIWQKRVRYSRGWKERVALVLLECGWRVPVDFGASARRPKLVSFLANTGARMDGDGLQAALKPVRDALVDCRVLSGDADKDGHAFVYSQRIDRACRGVEIRVSLASRGSAAVAAP